MEVVEPRGHREIAIRLWRAAAAGRLPHALAFEGPAGIGKHATARWLAAGLLCAGGPGPPCGTCGPCKRVRSGREYSNHPDLFLLDADLEGEEHLRLHRMTYRPQTPEISDPERCVQVFLDLCPLEGGWRIVLIRDAHRLVDEAQNALLKTLEEPRAATLLVLDTDRPAALLPTIRSRCVGVRFAPLGAEDCRTVLAAAGLAGERGARLARWSGGSPGQAVALARRGAEEMREVLARVLAGELSPRAGTERVLALEGDFGGSKARAKERNRARAFLDVAVAVVADLRRAAAGAPAEALRHGDLVAAGRPMPAGEADLAERVELLAEIRSDVERNLGPETIVERALLVCGEGAGIL
ncbi:MAG: hypothetical protein AB1726_06865 [Planctomycetota bacterium]